MREVFCELTPTAVDVAAEGPYIVREPAMPAQPESAARDEQRPPAEGRPGDAISDAPDRIF